MLELLDAIEARKEEMRHSYISKGRQESVAEHSWRMALMAFTIAPDEPVNVERCIKMALAHDLPEAIVGDVFALDPKARIGKTERELEGMKKLCSMISDKKIADELFALWNEYEEARTPEARFVKLLDKFEVLMQHNEAPLDTWAEVEKKTHYGMAMQHSERYGMLKELASQIDAESHEKLSKAGMHTEKLTQEEYEKFFGKRK